MKGLFVNVYPNPRSLAHYRPKYERNKEKAAHKSTASYFGHLLGARVALQRSPILRKDKYKKHNKIYFASIY